MSVRAYLVSRPSFDVEAFFAFLKDEKLNWRRSSTAQQAEEIVEVAGRICYLSFAAQQSSRTNAEYIANLVKMGHESVLEHVSWGFVLTGVSRALTHQLVRHRVGFAFSQLSQQYHEERDTRFVEPPSLAAVPKAHGAWLRAINAARDAYGQILDSLEDLAARSAPETRTEIRRAIRSAARSVLPNATETTIFVTANARALRYFLQVRGAIAGDEEMRAVSVALLRLLKVEAPALFADFAVETLTDGSLAVVHQDLGSLPGV